MNSPQLLHLRQSSMTAWSVFVRSLKPSHGMNSGSPVPAVHPYRPGRSFSISLSSSYPTAAGPASRMNFGNTSPEPSLKYPGPLQHGQGCIGQRDPVFNTVFHAAGRDAPFPGLHINFGPGCAPDFTSYGRPSGPVNRKHWMLGCQDPTWTPPRDNGPAPAGTYPVDPTGPEMSPWNGRH